MAGRPKVRATLDALVKLAQADGEETALEYITGVLASGDRLLDVCAKLAPSLGFEPSYGILMKALESEVGDKVKVAEALRIARKDGAHSKVEAAEEIVDTVGADKDLIARAKLQAEMRTWAAARNNRESYGDDKTKGVEINIGELHLGALQRIEQIGPPRVLPEPTPIAAAEDITNMVLIEAAAPNESEVDISELL